MKRSAGGRCHPPATEEAREPRVHVGKPALNIPVGDGRAAVAMLVGGQVLTLGSIVAAVALVWVRHRHASATERTQLRWLLWAGIMCVLMVLAGATLSVGGDVTAILLDLAVAALAVSVTIGLVRPGLGDVDALVAWTLTTAAVAVFVVAVDLAVLAAGTALLGERLDEQDVALVVLVLAVVVYGPLRTWLGGLVRRLLLGSRGDRYGAVSSLAERLETTGTVDEQLPALAEAVVIGGGDVRRLLRDLHDQRVDDDAEEAELADQGDRARRVDGQAVRIEEGVVTLQRAAGKSAGAARR